MVVVVVVHAAGRDEGKMAGDGLASCRLNSCLANRIWRGERTKEAVEEEEDTRRKRKKKRDGIAMEG